MKKIFTPLTGVLLAGLLVLFVAACGPATPPAEEADMAEDSAEMEEIDESAVDAEAAIDGEPAALPTTEPLELDGAVVTDSGLQYVEIVEGDGATPQEGDMVTMHFAAALPDGTPFGDSYTQGEPIQIIMGREQLFPGWEEGVLLMKEGGEAQLGIPPELAFGEAGFGGIVPPNSYVIIDVELLTVEPTPELPEISEDDLETTDSGLSYVDLEEGDGLTAEEGDIVSTHFTMWVDDGTFVASSENSEPLTFSVGSGTTVFPGWEEGVVGMQVGGVRQLVIPPELALGEQGGGDIPPNSTLVMEIELTDVIEPAEMEEVDPDDYTETESGLMYYDVVEGEGDPVEAGQTVSVHYTGWLEDGTKFDSSYDRGTPFTVTVGMGQVIPGWDEGLQGMQEGGKRQLVIPAELGYGAAGSGAIPPGATLIFDVEIVEVLGE